MGAVLPRDYLTISVPCMEEWYLQCNGYWPGSVGAVSVPCPLPSTSTSNLPAVSDVTECSAESLFLIATWAPGDTVIGSPKLMLAIVMVAALAAAGPLGASAVPVALAVIADDPVFCSGVEVLDPPHAVANTTSERIPHEVSDERRTDITFNCLHAHRHARPTTTAKFDKNV